MNGRKIEHLLWVLLAGASLLHLVAWSDSGRRNVEFLPDMVVAVPYESQSGNPVFRDGKTLQRPPAGTIARGHPPLRSGEVLLDVTSAWEDLPPEQQEAWNRLEGPVPVGSGGGETPDPAVEAASLRRGERLFLSFCAPCHGPGGAGDGPLTLRGVPPPPSLLADGARGLSDGRLYRIITAGRGNMPAYATQIEREDRWKALSYVRNLQSR